MKKTITLKLQPSDYGGERGRPDQSPLARAMTRETGHTFRHVGRILFTMAGNTTVSQIYNLGMNGMTAWRQWCDGTGDPIGEFVATIIPQTEELTAINEIEDRRPKLPPSDRPLPPSTLNPELVHG